MDYLKSKVKEKYEKCISFFEKQDNQQSINVMTSFISDAFKVFMATLLCVFVPQQCERIVDNKTLFIENFPSLSLSIPSAISNMTGSIMIYHTCSINENFNDLIDYNSFVLAFNFLTLGYFIYLYYIEISREKWMIMHLDYDKNKTDENILTLKTEYPEIMDELKIHNKKYMLAYKYLHIIYIMNFLFSAILVIHYYYLDFRTVTTLLTNFILCSNKIRLGRKLSMESYNKDLAYSFYNVNNISFNTIDPKLIPRDNNSFILESDMDNDNIDNDNYNDNNNDNDNTKQMRNINDSAQENGQGQEQQGDIGNQLVIKYPRKESVSRQINNIKKYITTL